MILSEESQDVKHAPPRRSTDSGTSFTESAHVEEAGVGVGGGERRCESAEYEVTTAASGRSERGSGTGATHPPAFPAATSLGRYGSRLDAFHDDEDALGEVLPPYTPRSEHRPVSSRARRQRLFGAFHAGGGGSGDHDVAYLSDEASDAPLDLDDGPRDPTRPSRSSRRRVHASPIKYLFRKAAPHEHGRRTVQFFLPFVALNAVMALIFVACNLVFPPRPHHPPHPGGFPPRRPLPRTDGEAWSCAAFDEADSEAFDRTAWRPPVLHDAQEGGGEAAIARLTEGDTAYRSINTTLSIPLYDNTTVDGRSGGTRRFLESFVHLSGPYAVGDIEVGTYAYDPAEEINALEGWTGPHIRVRVQAIYRVAIGAVADAERVDGWQELQRTSVCLMRRTGEGTINSTRADEPALFSSPQSRAGPHGPPARPGMGLGIYTEAAYNETSPSRDAYGALQFRVFVSIPVAAPEASTRITVPHLDMRGSLTRISVGNLSAAAFGLLHVQAALGDVSLQHVRGEVVTVNTAGVISGRAEASQLLQAESPLSSVLLDVVPSAAFDPAAPWQGQFERYTPPPMFPGHPPPMYGEDLRRPSPPLVIKAETSKADIAMNVVGWTISRPVNFFLKSALGSIHLRQHAMYEGPYALSTTLGKLTLQDEHAADPLGQERPRRFSMRQDDKIGQKTITGSLGWGVQSEADKSRQSDMRIESTLGNIVLVY